LRAIDEGMRKRRVTTDDQRDDAMLMAVLAHVERREAARLEHAARKAITAPARKI
jgi:hypothetical protein